MTNISQHIHKVFSGLEFNRLFYETGSTQKPRFYETGSTQKPRFYKFLSKNAIHYDFQYKQGLNVDINPFCPHGSCEKGGLYFADKMNILDYSTFGDYICEVEIPDDAQVYVESCKFKCDKFILHLDNKCNIKDFSLYKCYFFVYYFFVHEYNKSKKVFN
jgi:hypothetical protein